MNPRIADDVVHTVLAPQLEALRNARIAFVFAQGWTDGLALMPPTHGAVRAMLATVKRDPQEEIGAIPPRMRMATLAINAGTDEFPDRRDSSRFPLRRTRSRARCAPGSKVGEGRTRDRRQTRIAVSMV